MIIIVNTFECSFLYRVKMFNVGPNDVGVGSMRLLRCQHIGIGNANPMVEGRTQHKAPIQVVLCCSGT